MRQSPRCTEFALSWDGPVTLRIVLSDRAAVPVHDSGNLGLEMLVERRAFGYLALQGLQRLSLSRHVPLEDDISRLQAEIDRLRKS